MRAVLPVLVCLLAVPAEAEAIFDRLTGQFGSPFEPDMTCAEYPHSIGFSTDRRRAAFRWNGPMRNYLGEFGQEAGYSVIANDEGSIAMSLDGEARLTDDGKPVVWVLRLAQAVDGYCWGRTDWQVARCVGLHLRCPGTAPVS